MGDIEQRPSSDFGVVRTGLFAYEPLEDEATRERRDKLRRDNAKNGYGSPPLTDTVQLRLVTDETESELIPPAA